MPELVLEEREYCRVSIDTDILLKKVSELFPDDDTIPEQFRNMTFLAWIKADLEDRLHWKKHHKVLREKGYDI